MDDDGRSVTDSVREVYEPVCEPGATVPFKNLSLRKVNHSEVRELWAVYRDDEYIETLDVSHFRSASDLERALEALADEREIDNRLCSNCPLGSVPGD